MDVDLQPADGEMILNGDGTDGALFGYLKRTRMAEVSGDFKVQNSKAFRHAGWMSGSSAFRRAGCWPATHRPSAVTQEDDGKLDDFWFPVVCLRQPKRRQPVRIGY